MFNMVEEILKREYKSKERTRHYPNFWTYFRKTQI